MIPRLVRCSMGIGDDTIWIDVFVVRETELAYLFQTEAGDVWVAKSTIGARKKEEGDVLVRIEIPTWIAKKKGLLDAKDSG